MQVTVLLSDKSTTETEERVQKVIGEQKHDAPTHEKQIPIDFGEDKSITKQPKSGSTEKSGEEDEKDDVNEALDSILDNI
jgi:hypothetical protein